MTARFVIALSVLVLAAGIAHAGEKTVSAVDYLVDGPSLVDTPIRVTRCNLANANNDVLSCYAFPAGNTKTQVGALTIDGASLNREDLRKALNLCFDAHTKPDCWVNVSGTPALRYPGDRDPTLKDASLEWVKP